LGQLTSRLAIERTTVDGRPGFDVRLTEAAIRERQDFAIQQNTVTMRNRVNELGVAEAVVQRQGLDRILVELPGIQDPTTAKNILSSTATLEFHLVDQDNDAFEAQRRGRAPLGSELHHRREDGSPILLHRDVIASGDQLLDATPGYENGAPVVNVRLDAAGARKMLDTTVNNVGKLMAVLYIEDRPGPMIERDGKRVPGEPIRTEEVINDAQIQGVFSNRFRISGLPVFEAQNLALLLRAGSLAAPIVPIEERTIGPSLGQDNIDRGINAVLIGYLLVVIFIALWYRAFGMLANVALFVNVIMIMALMSLIPGAALTLPGIAGIVLTVGMSVDANVLIFERIREELGNGNSPQASIRAGWDKAYTTIVDSNLTTVIAAIVLFAYGTGPIKGFAVTLTLGIATSMFTAITVTRALVNLVYGNRTDLKTLSIGGRQIQSEAVTSLTKV
jgi:preprotein translocase subunit SecD